MALNTFLFGNEGRIEKTPRFRPSQESMFNQLGQMGMQGLQQTPLDFAPIEQREVSRYKQQTIPTIMERFASRPGNLGSSAMQGALAQGAGDLGERLAALRSNYNLQARNQLMNMLGMSLTPQDELVFQPGSSGFLGQAAPGVAQGLGSLLPTLGKTALGMISGGPVGAATAIAPEALNSLMSLLGLFGQEKAQNPNNSITYSNTIPNNNLA